MVCILLYNFFRYELSREFLVWQSYMLIRPEMWIGLRPFNEGVQLVYEQQISSNKAVAGHSIYMRAFLFYF